MPTTDELAAALRKADAAASAGDANAANDARRLAAALQKARTQAPAAPQSPAPQPVAPRAPGGGFDMAPSSPQARREMMTPQAAPQPMAAAPGAQYSFQPTPEMVASAPMRAEVQANNEAQRAKGLVPLTTEQGTKWVPDPAKQMGDIATQQRLDREATERREASRGYGAGMDMLVTTDDQGQLRPGTAVDRDIGKGLVSSPARVVNGAIGAVQSMGNIPSDLIDAGLQRVHSVGGGGEQGRAPRLDIPRIPIPAELESMTGALTEGLAQFVISRKAVGSVAPGGGLGAQLGKDALATGIGFDGSTGRMADIIDLNALPAGPLRDYAAWLKTQPDDSPLVGRLKNMIEDMTFSGPAVAPQAAVRGVQAVGNAFTPKPMTAGNAGGAAIEAARAAPQAPPAAQPSPAPVSQAPIPQAPRGAAVASPPAQRSPVGAPTPPAQVAAQAALPPPAGVMTPVAPLPQEAVDAFNAMPRKAREAMLRTMQSTGSDAQANTVMSRIWRGLTGQFGNSQEAMAQLRSLNNLPPEQQTMYALELMQRYGGDVETALPAMGRSWATGGGRKDQLFGGRDRAREIMDQNIPDQINSQGPRVTEIAEQKFGAGVVPAGEALEQELDALSGAYDNILSTKRNPTGRLRAQEKKDAVFKARDDLTAMLTSPEVMRTLPPNVKTEIMMQASEDIRRLKFPPETIQNVILQGDGKVLAPLFNGYGALEWSPDLWAHLAKQYPTQAAHSLQSALRKAGDAAFRNGDATAGRYYKRLRGESGKGGLLDTLERAVPNYKETRLAYGDAKSAQEAFDILENFRAAAASEGDVGSIITSLKGLPKRHRDMAENQITSIIRQEIGRKVDSPKLSELGKADRLPTPNLTALSNQNFLNALEDVFGARGKELADGIRLARAQTDALTSIHPRYNSRTTLNTEDVANAPKRYEDPTAVPGGVADGWVKGMAATAVPAAIWQPSAAPILLGAAAGKALYNGWKAGKLLNNTERNQLVDYLFRVRKPGDAAPPAPKKGIGSGGFIAGRAVRDAAIGATAGAAASGGDPNATLAGAVGGAGIGAARAVGRLKSSIIKPPPQPRRAPAVAPAAAQVAAPPQARPLPGQTSPAAYSATGAATGALVGAGLNPDDPGKGAVYGAIGGGVVGAGVGRLAKLGSPKPKAVKPPPGGGVKPPPVGAKAFAPVDGAPQIDTSSWTPTDFNAARKQLNEMMQDRRTATGQQLADLDSEITSLRAALQVDGPPSEFNDVPMASRFNAPVEGMWPKGSPEEKAIKSAIANKRWTTEPVPASKIIPTQDSVFFDYAKAAGRYAGDDRLPIMVKQGDQYFVADGHHRLMAQAGKDVVNARVIDLAPTPAGTGGKKPPAQAGFGGKARGVIDNLKQDAAIVGATSIAASANNPDDPAALGIPAAALLIGGKYGARLGNGLKRGPKPPPGARRFKAPEGMTFAGVNAKTADRVALARAEQMAKEGASRPIKPPPAQSGFGGGKGAPRPPSPIKDAAGRAAVGGAIGAAAGFSAEGQTQDYDAQIADAQAAIDRLETDKAFFATATPTQIQERLAKEGFNLGRFGADGKIGNDTAAAIRGYKEQIEKDLKAATDRRAQLEQDRAYQRTRPNAFQQGFRETAPWIGAGVGLALGLKGRAGAVAKSVKQAPGKIAKANALLTPGPVKSGSIAARDAANDRFGKINEFWREGGAGENVPFKTTGKGEWRPRPKAMPPSKLYPERVKRRWGAVDTGVVASGLAESVVSGQYAASLEGEIREAQQTAKDNPTEANLARVQSLQDLHAAAVAASRLGMFIAGGRVIGAMKMPYASTRPNVAEAEAELARLLAYIQKTKK